MFFLFFFIIIIPHKVPKISALKLLQNMKTQPVIKVDLHKLLSLKSLETKNRRETSFF